MSDDYYSDDEFEVNNKDHLNQSPYFANKDNRESTENDVAQAK